MKVNEVNKWLFEVEHPAKGDKNIVELGMVENVEIGEDSVTVTLAFSKHRDPLAEYLIGSAKAAIIRNAPAGTQVEIKTIIKDKTLSEERYKPQAVAARISMAKNCLVTPAAYRANAVLVGEDREAKMPEIADIYAEYCTRCKRNGAMDFDDLLLLSFCCTAKINHINIFCYESRCISVVGVNNFNVFRIASL
mgnify:CR=1 FL=1